MLKKILKVLLISTNNSHSKKAQVKKQSIQVEANKSIKEDQPTQSQNNPQKNIQVTIIFEGQKYTMQNAIANLLQYFNSESLTPFPLITVGDKEEDRKKVTGEILLNKFLYHCLPLKIISSELALKLKKEDKNFHLTGSNIYHIAIILFIYISLRMKKEISEEIKQKKQDISNAFKEIMSDLYSYDEVKNRKPLEKAVSDCLNIMADEKSIVIVIEDQTVNKNLLKDKEFISIITDMISISGGEIVTAFRLKQNSQMTDEDIYNILNKKKEDKQDTEKEDLLKEDTDNGLFD